jgi:PAS domain S-box-containing protein
MINNDATILIVDDNPANLEVLHHILDSVGYQVRVEIDSNRAIEQVRLEPPDLILLDIMMPDVDGFDICQQLKDNCSTKHIPVIFISALDDSITKVRGFNLGAVDYITKPFYQQEVISRIELHLKIRHLQTSLEQKNHQLQNMTDELEKQVARRTLALSRSLDDLQSTQTQLKEANNKLKNYSHHLEIAVFFKSRALKLELEERKKAEQELEASNTLLKSVIESSTDAIFVKDIQGRYLMGNSSLINWFEKTETEVIGQNDTKLFPPEIAGKLRQQDFVVMMTGETQLYDDVFYRKGTKRFFLTTKSPWRNQKGKTIGVVGISRDIGDRKKIEANLRHSEEKSRQIFENAPLAMSILDLETMQTLKANQAACQLFGYSQEELIELNTTKIFHPDDSKFDRELLKQMISGKNNRIDREKRYIKKNGEVIWGNLTATLIRDSDDNALYLLAMIKDITQRKQSEEKVQASLQEKEILLKEIHHRVKNNLYIISSLLYLQSKNIEDSKAIESFQESRNRITSMALIHEKLYQSKDLSSINFTEYVQNLAKEIFRSYGINHHIVRLQIDVVDLLLTIDLAIPCGLIINEVISNSLKYAFPGNIQGTIFVDLQLDRANNYILTVGDDGIGLPENFDYRNTKSLGLRLVCNLTEQLDGELELKQAKGTLFQITFPSKKGKVVSSK